MKNASIYFVVGIVVATLSNNPATGQIGKDTSIWQWTVSSDHHNSIVQVIVDEGMGTGVIVLVDKQKPVADGFEGYCLTAYHVVSSDQQRRAIRVKYRNGRGANRCKVVYFDKENDLALLWVWVPNNINAVPVATTAAMPRDQLEFTGLGGGTGLKCCLRHFSADAALPSTANVIYADLSLLPGDSGGPIFNANHELVGIISGGWFWWDGGVTTSQGTSIKATWPARACNTRPIHNLVAKLSSD